MKHKIVVAITGASGSVYAKILLDKLQQASQQIEDVSIVMSQNAKTVWETEMGNKAYLNLPFRFFEKHNFKVNKINGEQEIADVFKDILNAIK